jgi:hypothetical protein
MDTNIGRYQMNKEETAEVRSSARRKDTQEWRLNLTNILIKNWKYQVSVH